MQKKGINGRALFYVVVVRFVGASVIYLLVNGACRHNAICYFPDQSDRVPNMNSWLYFINEVKGSLFMPDSKVQPVVVSSHPETELALPATDTPESQSRYSWVKDHKLLFTESVSPGSLSSKSIDQYSIHSTESVDSGQVSMSENLERIKLIGRGAFGEVWLVRADGTLDEHALKIPFNHSKLEAELEKLLRLGQQRNIVSCLGIADIDGQQGLLMEYIPGMDLDDFLPEIVDQYLWAALSHADFWGGVQYIIKEMLTGIQFMEESGFVHQDIKPKNIRIHQEKLRPVIVDFGNSAPIGAAHTIGTEFYSPPESLANAGCAVLSDKFDTYAVGQIIYTLLAMITDHGVEHFFTANARYDDVSSRERAGLLMRLHQSMHHYQTMDDAGEYRKALTPITTKELHGQLQAALGRHEQLVEELQDAYARPGHAHIPLDCMLTKKLPEIVAGKIRVGRYQAGYESSLVKFVNAALHPAPGMRLNARTALQQPFLSDPLYHDELSGKNIVKRVFAGQRLKPGNWCNIEMHSCSL